MKPEKVEKSYLSRAFRKAVVTGLAALSLSFSAQAQSANNNYEDDVYNNTSKTTTTTNAPALTAVKTDTLAEPWQKDSSYVREMDLALKAYQAKVQAVNDKLEADTLRIKRERFISRSGNIDLMHVFTSGKQTRAAVSQTKANAAAQLSSMETSYNQQKEYIIEKYKHKYERQQAQILRMKKATATNVPKQEKIMNDQKDIDLTKKEMSIEYQKLQLEKQKLELELQIELLKKKKEALNAIDLSPNKKGPKP